MNILSPSILAADFTKLGEQISQVEEGGAEYLHIDVMDGMFVPAISLGMCVMESIRKSSSLVFDVHLMVTEPIRYVERFAQIGADIITVHFEACSDVGQTLDKIKEFGCKAGLSIKPGTDVSVLMPYLSKVDLILIMTVEPGFGGQKYIEASTERIRSTRREIEKRNPKVDLEVDGGIRKENVRRILEAGANVIVTGSAVFHGDITQNVKDFMQILNETTVD